MQGSARSTRAARPIVLRHQPVRRLTLAALGSAVLLAWTPLQVQGQAVTVNGEVAKELRFPPRGAYKNPEAVLQNYDPIADVTHLRLGISSGNPFSLVLKPLVQLDFEATYSGADPSAVPDSIILTGRVFRLFVFRQQATSVGQNPPNMQFSMAQQSSTAGAGVPGPMLSFMVSPSANASGTSNNAAWRTSVASVAMGSNQVVAVDDTGIWFRGERWLSTIANIIDLSRKKGELPLHLIARADTGRFSLDRLPERVRNVLHDGLRIAITEDVHRLSLPVSALLQMASAPQGVKSRFGMVDFAIEGDELNALQDFVSRLAPKSGSAVLQMAQGSSVAAAQSGTTPPIGTQPVSATAFAAPSLRAQTGTTSSGVSTPGKGDTTGVASLPVGTEIDLRSSSRKCVDSLNVGDQFTATVAQPIVSGAGARIDAGTSVLLMVSDAQPGAQDTDPNRLKISAVSATLGGHAYALHGSVVKLGMVKEAEGAPPCLPANGALVLRLSRPFRMPR